MIGPASDTRALQHAIIPQILAAVLDLARRDFTRLDRSDVGRAHLAIHRSDFALVETRDFVRDARIDPVGHSQMRASERVRHSRATFVSRSGWRSQS